MGFFDMFRRKKKKPHNRDRHHNQHRPSELYPEINMQWEHRKQEQRDYEAQKAKKKDLSNKAFSLMLDEDYEKSLECFDEALKIKIDYNNNFPNKKSDINEGDIWFQKGILFNKWKRYANAIECYEKSIRIKGNSGTVLESIGENLKELGRYEEAREYYKQALEFDPESIRALMELDKFEEVIEVCDEWLQKSASSRIEFAYWQDKGIALGGLGRFKEATEYLDKIDPKYGWDDKYSRKQYAYNEIEPYLRKAIEENPNDIDAIDALSKCLHVLGDEESARYFRQRANELLAGAKEMKPEINVSGDYVAQGKVNIKDSIVQRSNIGNSSGLTNDDRLQLLEDRLLNGDITERTYDRLQRKYASLDKK